MAITVPEIDWFDPTVLQHQLDGDQAEVRERVRELLAGPSSRRRLGSHRRVPGAGARVVRDAGGEGLPIYGFPKEFGGQDEPAAAVAMFETLAYGDLSLLIKFGVQFGLWGGAVLQLGTSATTSATWADHEPRGSRLLRDVRDRPWIKCPADRDHRDI